MHLTNAKRGKTIATEFSFIFEPDWSLTIEPDWSLTKQRS